jgi:hypothetical protein
MGAGGFAQRVRHGERVVLGQRKRLDQLSGPQVVHRGTVGEDRHAVPGEMSGDHAHPAGRASGDEEDLDAGRFRSGQRVDRAPRDGLVVAQQGPVQVGGDQPRRGGGVGLPGVLRGVRGVRGRWRVRRYGRVRIPGGLGG